MAPFLLKARSRDQLTCSLALVRRDREDRRRVQLAPELRSGGGRRTQLGLHHRPRARPRVSAPLTCHVTVSLYRPLSDRSLLPLLLEAGLQLRVEMETGRFTNRYWISSFYRLLFKNRKTERERERDRESERETERDRDTES